MESIGFRFYKVIDSYFRDGSIDHMFMMILDSVYQNGSHKSELKSLTFDSSQQLLAVRSQTSRNKNP